MMAGIKEVRVIKSTKNKKDEDRLRVAAYCRVSSDADDNLNSFFAQVKYYIALYGSNHEEPKMAFREGVCGRGNYWYAR